MDMSDNGLSVQKSEISAMSGPQNGARKGLRWY
jgi:hypothetical protein